MAEQDCELAPLNPEQAEIHDQNGPVLTHSLLTAVTSNNEELLEYVLQHAAEEDFKRKQTYSAAPMPNPHILTVACVDGNISLNIFSKLFSYTMAHFGHLEFTEEDWYYWEPLHFAAYYTNLEKLRAIVDTFKSCTTPNKLNALSILSENALHVLLEYGRRVESFNVQLSNGWESRICHVVAEERGDIVECAKILIDAGIDINHNNIWNETPLIIAIRYRLLGVIELLLKRKEIDLDTCRDSFRRKSARDLLRENEICLHLLTPNTIIVSPAKALFTFLKDGDEENFLRYNNENIRQYVMHLDGDHEDNSSGTMLHLCLIKGYIEYENEHCIVREPEDTDIMKTKMLQFFCKGGFGRSIEHLLSNGAPIGTCTRIFGGLNAFEMAIKLSYYPFLTILLEHRSKQITHHHIMEVLKNTNEASFESNNCNTKHVLFLLISKLEMFYEAVRGISIDFHCTKVLNKILDLYLTHTGSNDEYKDNICQILRLGASLTGCVRDGNKPRLKEISYDTLRAHLDECIGPNNDVCYDTLIKDNAKEYSETEALHYLSHDPKKGDLLNHPALIYLIHAKWLRSSKFFYVNLAIYVVFLFFLYWYMILLQIDVKRASVTAIFFVLLLTLTIKEALQLVLYWRRYFFDYSNYLEVSVIACCFINVFSKHEVAMILAILLSTLILLLMLGQLPRCTKYMIIFSSTKYFLEYASFYFIQFVSFALCFFILLPPEKQEEGTPYGEILKKLFETLIYFIGQYDGDINGPPNFPVFGRAVVAVFVFCMTIILNNLLVGLIVTDMDIIQKTSKQQRQIKMIRYISRIETFLERAEKVFCFKVIRRCCGDIKVFKFGAHKVKNIANASGCFDDDDKAYLKEIHENRMHRKNVLKSLYEYIVGEIYIDRESMRENRDILFKLSRLEDQLRRGKPVR